MVNNYNFNNEINMPFNILNISSQDTTIDEVIEYNKQISVFNNGNFNLKFLIIYKINDQDIVNESGVFNKGFTRYLGIPSNVTSIYLTITILNNLLKEKLIFKDTVSSIDDIEFEVSGDFSKPNILKNS